MKVNSPGSPLSGGAEPLDSLGTEAPHEAKRGQFADALSQSGARAETAGVTAGVAAGEPVRAALAEIAQSSDLTTGEGSATAVRESARLMVTSRLREEFRETEQGRGLVERLSEYVSEDPLLNSQLLSILHKLKAA